MSAFLKEIECFRGSGERNEKGETLEKFLESYNAERYKKASVTADVIVMSYEKSSSWKNSLKVLMIKRRNHPCIGYWAIPGGFAEMQESIEDTARRELIEETGIQDIPMVQLYTYGEVERDPRDRVITTAYLALVEAGTVVAEAGDDAKDAKWWGVNVLFESEETVESVTKKRYRIKLETSGEKELTAVIVERIDHSTPLNVQSFHIEESKGIAFDHARYILQAYAYLDKIIKSN